MKSILTLVAVFALIGPTAPATAGGVDAEHLDTLSWRSIGPPRGGRATTCCGVPGNPLLYYMGVTGGGVWKTENAGISWQNISDGFFGTGSVGAIAVAPSDPNVIYVGMGERDPRGNFSHGDGVYKSTDAGKTWTHIGLADTRQIGKIRIHPQNHDHVYVAALGHIWGPNEERGVFRSTNGGATWENILYVDDTTGAVDLAMDPTNPRILFAGMWTMQRRPWRMDSGGEGSGLYKSTDGGDTWDEVTRGLPRGTKGKIGVSVSPVDPDRVFAIVEADDGGVFRSDDGGDRWRRVNEERKLRQRAWYYTHIYADSQDIDTVYVMNVGFHKSTDGGATYSSIRVPHGDNHDLWINPDDNANMVNANDGGANVSFDGGASWSRQDMQPTAQFYHVICDNAFPYNVLGAQQDNSTVRISSQPSWRRAQFHAVGGGESGYIAPRHDDPDIVYAGSYGGLLTRYDHKARSTRNITVWPDNPMGGGVEGMKYRFQWTFPIVHSRHDYDVLYTAGNVVFKSTNEGHSWQIISPDLTRDDKSKQGTSGGPITQDNTSVEYYCTIFALAESHHDGDVLWAGSDDGLVHVTRDGGATWENVTPAGLGEWATISQIDASPHEPGCCYLAINRYRLDDFRPYVYTTTDYGQTWRDISHGIADDAFVRAVREDPKRRGLLYAGTETGVWCSFDDGAHWQELQLNLPRTPITDLVVKEDDLVVATQGRSFWILDDLTLLHELSNETTGDEPHLFTPRKVYRTGRNTPRIRYYLPGDVDDISMTFLDANGGEVRKHTGGLSKSEGVHEYRWNMRYEGAEEVPGAVSWGGSTAGPQVAPGMYTVRMAIGDDTYETTLEIAPDPRVDTTAEEYAAQLEFLLAVRDSVDAAHKAVNQIRTIRAQVEETLERAGDAEEVNEAAKTLLARIKKIEETILQTKSKSSQDPLNFPIRLNDKIGGTSGGARGNYPPTEQAIAVFEELDGQLQVQLNALEQAIATLVPAFNDAVRAAEIPAVVIGDE